MSEETYPKWLRGVDALIGLITVFLGAWILFSPDLVEATLVLIMAIGLFLIGVIRFGKGITIGELKTTSRAMKIISGLSAIGLSLMAVALSNLAIVFLVGLLTFAIMLVGLSRIVVGYGEESMSSWMKITNIVGGGVVFLFGLIAAIFTDLGFLTLRLMISGVFFVLGLIRIAAASKGELS